MKKNKSQKILVTSILIVLLAGIALVVGWKFFDWFNPISYSTAYQTKIIEMLDPDIIVYGDLKKSKKIDLKHRKIDSITREALSACGEDGYHLIVISDVFGKLQITEEELKLIYSYCTDKHFDIYYTGGANAEKVYSVLLEHIEDYPENGMLFMGSAYRNGFPFEYTEEGWKRTDEENAYIYDPYALYNIGTQNDLVRAQKDTLPIWENIMLCVNISIND